jgi:hypothetical protein
MEMHTIIKLALFSALAFSHAVQCGENAGGEVYSGDFFSVPN